MRRLDVAAVALAALVLVLALGAPPALGQSAPLSGPPGTSLDKVLVIGTDGTRWDLVKAAMKAGRAPNLASLRRHGFGRPSLLEYGPQVLTLSEVGWSSIASGVWPDKHGVDGRKFNMDPGQATKNGYSDFLTRIENRRKRLSTFLASDWPNIGLAENGGPIFGKAIDARFALGVEDETVQAWDQGDEQVTRAAVRYLRRGDPDAGFVYLGLVDETAHLVGSATPSYPAAISTTDRRIGRLVRAIRSRPSYRFESWTILVTTDHGQRPLDYPSLVSHLGKTKLELTAFVFGTGPGLGSNVSKPRIVDIAPTVLHQLGLRVPPSWNLDGRSLARAARRSSAFAAVRGPRGAKRLVTGLSFGIPPRGVRAVVLRLPAGVRVKDGAGSILARENGRRIREVRLVGGRTVIAKLPHRALRTFSVETASGALGTPATLRRGRSPTVSVSLRGRRASLGTLAVRLAGISRG